MFTHSMQCCIALCALLALAQAAGPSFQPYGTCDDFNAESTNEGYCSHRYQDSVGLWTIGIGFNMEQSGASSIMANCFDNAADATATFNALNQGPNSCSYNGVTSQVITKDLASCLLYTELVAEESCVKTILGTQFDSIPQQVRSGMIDMAYNMGCAGLKSFSTMISLIKTGKYSDAASSAKSSKWCGQVHGRCDRTTSCIANIGTAPPRGSGSGSNSPPPPPPPPPATSGSGSGNGGCFTFQSGLCPGTSDCQCSLGQTCGSKTNTQSVHNATEIFEAKRRELQAQGLAQTCANLGGTCYTVIHHQCPGASSCLAAGSQC